MKLLKMKKMLKRFLAGLCLSIGIVSYGAFDVLAGNYSCPATGKVTQLVSRSHAGADIANKSGPMVGAARAGVVCDVRDYGNNGYGKMVTLKHTSPERYTRYAHLNKHSLRKGDSLALNADVGQMGCTGHCIPKGAIHLHWEVRKTEWGAPCAIDLPLNKNVNRGDRVPVSD